MNDEILRQRIKSAQQKPVRRLPPPETIPKPQTIPTVPTKTAALYIRVSTDRQTTDNQLLALHDYARRRGYEVVAVYDDSGQSGAKKHRPAFDQLMRDAKLLRFDAVIVSRFDRFARSSIQLLTALEEFQAIGIDFISLAESLDTTTAVGKMVFTFIGAIAEFERSLIRERIQLGLKRAKVEGKKLGRPVAIYDRQLLRDPALSIRQISEMTGVPKSVIARDRKKEGHQMRINRALGRISVGRITHPLSFDRKRL